MVGAIWKGDIEDINELIDRGVNPYWRTTNDDSSGDASSGSWRGTSSTAMGMLLLNNKDETHMYPAKALKNNKKHGPVQARDIEKAKLVIDFFRSTAKWNTLTTDTYTKAEPFMAAFLTKKNFSTELVAHAREKGLIPESGFIATDAMGDKLTLEGLLAQLP